MRLFDAVIRLYSKMADKDKGEGKEKKDTRAVPYIDEEGYEAAVKGGMKPKGAK